MGSGPGCSSGWNLSLRCAGLGLRIGGGNDRWILSLGFVRRRWFRLAFFRCDGWTDVAHDGVNGVAATAVVAASAALASETIEFFFLA
eukprot:610277-Amorphochlora_amoeboformis.AAC.1